MTHDLEAFKARFVFSPELAFKVGIERECFIVDGRGEYVPHAPHVLPVLQRNAPDGMFTYELSACQVEGRTAPLDLFDVPSELRRMQYILDDTLSGFGLVSSYKEVAPDTMPLDVYPDARYLDITSKLPREKLLAACRVIATHVQIGMPDHETALRVYNRVLKGIVGFCGLGDKSNGERLKIYREFAPDCDSPAFADWDALHRYALVHGFVVDVRQWWGFVRISRHGTIEFRMFGATPDEAEVYKWAQTCRALCLASK